MGIFVDQVGYETNEQKLIMSTQGGSFSLVDEKTNEVVCSKEAIFWGEDKLSRESVWKIDISDVNKEGCYRLVSSDGEKSDLFEIGNKVYKNIQKDLSKALYFQRCGCALEEKYAGIYTHKACHTDDVIVFEDYINKVANPEKYSLKGGWHDAGDFGRYSTAAAVAVGHILYAYELFPESMQGELNIPETGNGIPDILNECRYELDWLINMQKEDGGVYHKLTAYVHAPFIMPEEDHDQFLLYPVSSMAVADYVAVMALASRVYSKFDKEFSDKALKKARKSFEWLMTNDYIGFKNPAESRTGEYTDPCDDDERMWAYAEMLRTDLGDNTDKYRELLKKYAISDIGKTDFGWTDVAGFAAMSVLTDEKHTAGKEIENIFKDAFDKEADRLIGLMDTNAYELAMDENDFVWGSNMVLLNRCMILCLAGIVSDDVDNKANYDKAIYEQMHYLLGRNALNRSYVTGYGEHAYKNPHNRPTAMDGIDDPMPGWVSGGPFKGFCDADAVKILPKGTAPMKCHADVVGSYSTNEITIYWNSPAIFVTAYLNQCI